MRAAATAEEMEEGARARHGDETEGSKWMNVVYAS
jgi:hypothetical protein